MLFIIMDVRNGEPKAISPTWRDFAVLLGHGRKKGYASFCAFLLSPHLEYKGLSHTISLGQIEALVGSGSRHIVPRPRSN